VIRMLSLIVANVLLFSVVYASVKWAVREERRRNAREERRARHH
jgi:hypothetical protein